MFLNPKTLRKYHEADETHEASNDWSSTPRCNIGLNRRVSGKGTLVVTKPENIQLIQPPMTTIGKTLIKFPLTKSVNIADEFGVAGGLFCVLKYPDSSLLKKCRLMANDWGVKYFPFSRSNLARIIAWLKKQQRLFSTLHISIDFFSPVLKLCQFNFLRWRN